MGHGPLSMFFLLLLPTLNYQELDITNGQMAQDSIRENECWKAKAATRLLNCVADLLKVLQAGYASYGEES